jgi:hypothetical protein
MNVSLVIDIGARDIGLTLGLHLKTFPNLSLVFYLLNGLHSPKSGECLVGSGLGKA